MPMCEASEQIGHARFCVRRAAKEWRAADLKSEQMALALLEESATDLKTAIVLLAVKRATMAGELQASIASLRRDVRVMIRIVDAQATFRPGQACHRSGYQTSYDGSGKAVRNSDPATAGGVIG